jgi:mannose-6-phosphate isomerase-like protein (cupin superfamily)
MFDVFKNDYITDTRETTRKKDIVINEEKEETFDIRNIEKETVQNENYRKVLFTGKNIQLVLMSLKPMEEIGEEIHDDTDQFFRVDSGIGEVHINGEIMKIKDGTSIIVPQGAKHNIINTSKEKKLKLYTIYSPPHHPDNLVIKNKKDE